MKTLILIFAATVFSIASLAGEGEGPKPIDGAANPNAPIYHPHPNSGAPNVLAGVKSGFSRQSQTRQLRPYVHELVIGDANAFSIEGVEIAPANLSVTTTTDPNCGSAEYGYQSCIHNAYQSESAVEVRVFLQSPTVSSDQPSQSVERFYFKLNEFTSAQLGAISQNSKFFDPFGSQTARSRGLARILFHLTVTRKEVEWTEPVYGNVCTSTPSAGEHTDVFCNVIGERSRSRWVPELLIEKN